MQKVSGENPLRTPTPTLRLSSTVFDVVEPGDLVLSVSHVCRAGTPESLPAPSHGSARRGLPKEQEGRRGTWWEWGLDTHRAAVGQRFQQRCPQEGKFRVLSWCLTLPFFSSSSSQSSPIPESSQI